VTMFGLISRCTSRTLIAASSRCVHMSAVRPGLSLTFASPGEVFYDKVNVKQVDVSSLSGDFGVVEHHVPLLGVLKPGVLVVHDEQGASKKFFVSSGSVTVNEDSSIQILAEEATVLEKLDIAAVREGLTKAQQEFSVASSDEAKAEAQIAVECYEALAKSLEH